jgi:hypothetical protein
VEILIVALTVVACTLAAGWLRTRGQVARIQDATFATFARVLVLKEQNPDVSASVRHGIESALVAAAQAHRIAEGGR